MTGHKRAGIAGWKLDLKTEALGGQKEFFNILGLTPTNNSICLSDIYDVVEERDYKTLQNAFLSLKKGASDKLIKQVTITHPQGKRRVELRCERTGSMKDQKHLCVGSIQDLTELIIAEKHEANIEKYIALGKLVGYFGHQFRTPLQTVSNCIGIVKYVAKSLNGKREGANKKSLNIVAKDLSASFHTMKNSIDYLEDTLSGTPEDVQEMNVNDITKQVANLFEGPLQHKHIELIEKYGADLPSVSIYEAAAKQVLINIMNNAIEAIGKGGKLLIRTSLVTALDDEYYDYIRTKTGVRADEYVIIEIKDSGCGISDEIVDYIFDFGYSTKKDRENGQPRGTGLGLTQCRNYMELHGGYIELVNNRDQEGTTAKTIFPGLRRSK